MSTAFTSGDAHLLKRHLLALTEVEFFTIPFYLTAVYSFTNGALNLGSGQGTATPTDVQQETLSVAVQEMYHLQLAANLSNAFGVTPNIPSMTLSGLAIPIPHLEQNGKPLIAGLGNLPAEIQAMIEVESPDPNPDFPPPNEAVTYASISDLYHATLQLLAQYLKASVNTAAANDEHFQPGHNQVAYGTFPQTYKHNTIESRGDVATCANAITDQGEGDLVSTPGENARLKAVQATLRMFFVSGPDGTVLPEFQPAAGSRFAKYGALTHFSRFVDIQEKITANSAVWTSAIGGPVFYEGDGVKSSDLPEWAPSLETVQDSINTVWSYVIDQMQSGFANGSLSSTSGSGPNYPTFNDAMMSFKYLLPLAWQWGAIPAFVYRAGVTGQAVQDALDAADPYCLSHWDALTIEVRKNHPLNVCQGLNACKGQGWGGIATIAGNGACATADFHSCGGFNSCKGQGGCGYLSTNPDQSLLPAANQFTPGKNPGSGNGGCQSPVGTKQQFSSSTVATISQQVASGAWTASEGNDLSSLVTQHVAVWDHARTLFGTSDITPNSGKIGNVDYDGTTRRSFIQPTATS